MTRPDPILFILVFEKIPGLRVSRKLFVLHVFVWVFVPPPDLRLAALRADAGVVLASVVPPPW